MVCAKAVPAAAPAAPRFREKIKKGTNKAFKIVKSNDAFKGVAVSPRPLKMPLTTSHKVAEGAPIAATFKYPMAEARIGDSSDTPATRDNKNPPIDKFTTSCRAPTQSAKARAAATAADDESAATKLMLVLSKGSL